MKNFDFDFQLWFMIIYYFITNFTKKNECFGPPPPPSLWLTVKNLGFVKISYPDLINIH